MCYEKRAKPQFSPKTRTGFEESPLGEELGAGVETDDDA